MAKQVKEIAWIKAARKAFLEFPEPVQDRALRALTLAGQGQKTDIAKPMQGLGSGVFEIAMRYKSDAYRTVYAVQIEDVI